MKNTIVKIVMASLLVAGSVSAKPRVVQIAPLVNAPIVINSTPIRFNIIFSEPVFGFEQEDIITNGRLLTLSGRDTTYTALIIPTNTQVIIDLLADSVHNIRQQGNDLLPIPFVWNLDNSPPPSAAAFIPRTSQFGGIAGYYQPAFIQPLQPVQPIQAQPLQSVQPVQIQPLQQAQPQPIIVQQAQPQPVIVQQAQPQPVQQASPVQPQPPPPEPVQPTVVAAPAAQPPPTVEDVPPPRSPEERRVQLKYTFNVGALNDAPSFINIDSQTGIQPGTTAEISLGAEVFHRPGIWRRGLGYFANLGYQQSSYESSQPDAEASYTAFPFELGINMYFNDYLSAGFGGIMHLNGEYKHKGNIGEAIAIDEEISLSVANGANSFDAGLPGLLLDFNFIYQNYGAALRFISLPLNELENSQEALSEHFRPNVNNDIQIRTQNAIETIGLFIKIQI